MAPRGGSRNLRKATIACWSRVCAKCSHPDTVEGNDWRIATISMSRAHYFLRGHALDPLSSIPPQMWPMIQARMYQGCRCRPLLVQAVRHPCAKFLFSGHHQLAPQLGCVGFARPLKWGVVLSPFCYRREDARGSFSGRQ
jgi:hypothetical protein